MFLARPLPRAANPETFRVEHEVDRSDLSGSLQIHSHGPQMAHQARAIGHRSLEPKELDQAAREPFGLAQRQFEGGTEDKCCLDGQVRVFAVTAGRSAPGRDPTLERVCTALGPMARSCSLRNPEP